MIHKSGQLKQNISKIIKLVLQKMILNTKNTQKQKQKLCIGAFMMMKFW